MNIREHLANYASGETSMGAIDMPKIMSLARNVRVVKLL